MTDILVILVVIVATGQHHHTDDDREHHGRAGQTDDEPSATIVHGCLDVGSRSASSPVSAASGNVRRVHAGQMTPLAAPRRH